ncbi:ABC transporter substrate-binding protein [Streptomyces sp. NBC_00820]|uniref:ABC transporter substrate-binding protein n=1 Tax=Streptomyces sp. NBC_00820 TaxID=2975842 RepID=UPI002ED30870|nr:ABC transporter substrate-binding protein [Streptomyces sp. NBC_00820]
MAVPHRAPSGFPDDEGADDFVREFRQAVVPAERDALAHTPPLVILDVEGEGPEYDGRVRRLIGALECALRGQQDVKTVPYALPAAEDDSDLLTGAAARGLGLGPPKHMTPDRLPGFWPLWDSIGYIREHAQERRAPGADVLRDYAHEQVRTHRRQRREGRLQVFLWALGGSESPPVGGIRGWLLGSLWHGITRTFPRWCWERRKTRRLVRAPRPLRQARQRWLGSVLGMSGDTGTLFAVMDEVADRQMSRLVLPLDHPRHQESLFALEQLLTRALLEDLKTPAVGTVRPMRRRRTARPVLLVPLPRQGRPGVQAAERFLRAFHQERHHTAHAPGPLVIAVGRPSERLLHDLGDPVESSLTQAGRLLHQSGPDVVLARLREEPFSREGLYIRPTSPTSYRVGGRPVTAGVAGGTALAVALAGIGGVVLLTPTERTSTSCVAGDTPVAGSKYAAPVPLHPKQWYDATLTEIRAQNKRAERFAAQGKTVRTVVVFASNSPTSETETLFDGTIPELRGIALWQLKLNNDAVSDDSRVPLRVDVRTTGKSFENAEQKARELVGQIKHGTPGKGGRDYEKVIGVLGFAQSKESTRSALKILEKAELPVIGTTATADEMLVSADYWPFTPLNSTEARIEANFANDSPVVARASGGCEAAQQAVVIQSSADLYSKSLADKFLKDFRGTTQLVNFSQTSDFTGAPAGTPKIRSAHDLAATVCDALRGSGPTVVYWTARARDFVAFVNALDTQGTCTHHDITMLGGNELTNVALTGEFNDKNWLRLYYSAHRLPAGDAAAGDKTRQFAAAYDAFVAGPAHADPWRDDGHSAVSYDAFHVLSRAADMALSGQGGVDPNAMLTALRSGITFDGATGYVSYGQGSNMPPRDKTLVLLRQTEQGPRVALACGAYQQEAKNRPQRAACTEHRAP